MRREQRLLSNDAGNRCSIEHWHRLVHKGAWRGVSRLVHVLDSFFYCLCVLNSTKKVVRAGTGWARIIANQRCLHPYCIAIDMKERGCAPDRCCNLQAVQSCRIQAGCYVERKLTCLQGKRASSGLSTGSGSQRILFQQVLSTPDLQKQR
jgi:hypothetical protein